MDLLTSIREEAKEKNGKIVLPESNDERVLEAAFKLKEKNISTPILVSDDNNINDKIRTMNINLDDVPIYSPDDFNGFDDFIETYYQKRQHKDITKEEAETRMRDRNFFGTMLVEKGLADGCLSGADTPTGEVLRPALHILGTAEGVQTVSSDMLMIINPQQENEKVISFADCAVMPDPDEKQVAEIAMATAQTHQTLVQEKPKIAMLSFSTKGSAKHEKATKMQKATEIVREESDFCVDGELQADAAIDKTVAQKKAPESPLKGEANVLIFPELQAGNIGYKLVQRIGGVEAVGPIIQGLSKPMNDLSRGCSIDDIINVAAILCNLK